MEAMFACVVCNPPFLFKVWFSEWQTVRVLFFYFSFLQLVIAAFTMLVQAIWAVVSPWLDPVTKSKVLLKLVLFRLDVAVSWFVLVLDLLPVNRRVLKSGLHARVLLSVALASSLWFCEHSRWNHYLWNIIFTATRFLWAMQTWLNSSIRRRYRWKTIFILCQVV